MPRLLHRPLRKRRSSLILCLLTALPALVAVIRPASAADGRPYTDPLKSFKGAAPWRQVHEGNHQRYRLVLAASGGHVRIVSESTGKVADVADCGTANGTDVRQWTWLDNTFQQWRLVATT